jgi:hypothetical protein
MHFIDTIFSSSFWMTTIIMVWIFLFVCLAFFNPFKKKSLNMVYKGLMYVVATLIMVIPLFLYYGLAYDFKKMTMGATTICLLEEYERGDDGPSETVCRLSVLKKATGERTGRKYVGYSGELLSQRGDTVAYLYNDDLYLMDAGTLKEISHVRRDEWAQKYPELQDGVEHIQFNSYNDPPRKSYLVIQGKNGNNYWYEPYAGKLYNAEPDDQKITGIYSTGYDIYDQPAGNGYHQTVLTQVYVNNSERKKIAPGESYKNMFGTPAEENFLEPFFLGIDMEKKYFVFRHYRTTDRRQMWIEARDFNFKTLWKKDAKALGASDSNCQELITVSQLEKGLLYFNMGGFMICLEPVSGKVKWKVRL